MSPVPPTSPTVAALTAQIIALLPGGLPTSLTAASKGADAYEGYGFALAVAAANDVGLAVTYEDGTGTAFAPSPALPITLRTSPSYMTTGNFTHAVLAVDGVASLEIHTGIYVAGTSRAEHECDVVILRRAAGVAARAAPPVGLPRARDVIWAFEAKFYDGATVGIDIGREYLGLNADVGGGSSRRTSLYVTKCRPSVRRLLVHHGRVGTLFEGVGPTSDAEDNLRSHLRGVFEKAVA